MQCFDSGLCWQYPVLLPAYTLVPIDVPWPLPVLSHNSSKKETIRASNFGICCAQQKARARKGAAADQSRVGDFVIFCFISGGSVEDRACILDFFLVECIER